MTSHSSSGLGIYLVAHRRFRPKPPADGILKYKKKKKKEKKTPQTPATYPRQERLGAGISVRIHPVATGREVEPGGAKKYHSPLAGHAELVANIM